MDLPGYLTFIYLIKWNRSWLQLYVSLLSDLLKLPKLFWVFTHTEPGRVQTLWQLVCHAGEHTHTQVCLGSGIHPSHTRKGAGNNCSEVNPCRFLTQVWKNLSPSDRLARPQLQLHIHHGAS